MTTARLARRRAPLVERPDVGKIREMGGIDVAARFAFGAAVSVGAGLVSLAFGPRAGGIFLAFPGILPASLTLIRKKEGLREADRDVAGAVFGGLGLVGFALATVWALHRLPIAAALLLALAVWVVVSVGLYLAVEAVRRRRTAPRA